MYLGARVVPKLIKRSNKTRDIRTKTDIAPLVTTTELKKINNFNYPSGDQERQALVEKPLGDSEAPNWQDGGL